MRISQLIFVLTVLFAMMCLACNTGSTSQTSPSKISDKAPSSPSSGNSQTGAGSQRAMNARTIVFSDTGERVDESDIRVRRIMYLFEYVGKNTKATDDEIVKKTLAGQGVLRDTYGVQVSIQQFLEDAKKLVELNLTKPPKQQSLLGDYDSVVLVVIAGRSR